MTRKRMTKLIMGMGYPRNVANAVALYVQVRQLKYEDFREIMDDIQKNADDIVRRDKMRSDDWTRYFEIAKSLTPTPGNPYPASSLNRPLIDFDLPMQARLARVFIANKRRKDAGASKGLAATIRKLDIEASRAFASRQSALLCSEKCNNVPNYPISYICHHSYSW